MRENFSFNTKWAFTKQATDIPPAMPRDWVFVNLPHTWNDIDGQDGGNDYYRGKCFYAKELSKSALPKGEKYFLEIGAASSVAEVYLNGKKICRHEGGYSLFRVEITDALSDENLFVISVDNSYTDKVYPQMADFTFYGGIYRGVRIIATGKTHFDLEHFGDLGMQITPAVRGERGTLDIKCRAVGGGVGEIYKFSVYSMEGELVCEGEGKSPDMTLVLEKAKLWQGRKNPYLYTVRAEIIKDGEVIDALSDRIGFRTFSVDSERGFILNGEEYPLRGVSRHQDRACKGVALSAEDHREDMELIAELGANTVRLAHYQQDKHMYDLCDEYGMVVWAEIPYISENMPTARDNAISQMRELVLQNYNHPSICFWGLSNEITMKGESEDIVETHRILNDLCHTLDKSRLTAVAAVSPCPTDSEYLKIPDLVAYNHYFGWYGGEVSMNGPWFDKFHKEHPTVPIGCSEYGCEALNYHSSKIAQGDYTEEYQAYYHEEMIKQLFRRKYLFATYVWNMFDFGADAREEGGEAGLNHKGLVTFDRKYKKDSFYAYKAWLSDEPFVHIAGKRYARREGEKTKITVYSNQPTVELYINDEFIGKESSEEHFFFFEVKTSEEMRVVAKAGECRDEVKFTGVETYDEKYRLRDSTVLLNWFDITEKEGYLSLNSKISEIQATEEGRAILEEVFARAGMIFGKKEEEISRFTKKTAYKSDKKGENRDTLPTFDKKYGLSEETSAKKDENNNSTPTNEKNERREIGDDPTEIAKQNKKEITTPTTDHKNTNNHLNSPTESLKTEKSHFEMNEAMTEMMGGFTFLRLSGMLGMFGLKFTKEELLDINKRLNLVKKLEQF